MKPGFIYIWRDNLRNKYYIGSHQGTIDDGYLGSGKFFLNAYSKRPNDFKRRIIKEFDVITRKELLSEEQKWLKLIDKSELGAKYYNLKNVAAGGDIISNLSEEKRKQHKEKSIAARQKGAKKDRLKNPEKWQNIVKLAGKASSIKNGNKNLKTDEVLEKRSHTDAFMTPLGPRPFLTKAAKELNMSYSTLRKLVDRGEGGYHWLNKGNHFYK